MRKKFELELSEKAKTNPKAIWSYIKSKSKTREEIGDLHLNPEDTNSEKTDDNKTKANILSEYFASVFTSETEGQIPELGKLNITTEMEDIVVDEETVLKHLAKLKVDKSPGLDKLHPRLLVEVRNEIKKTLSIPFNQSINSKSLPNDWSHRQKTAGLSVLHQLFVKH